jgi:hypothetical protein
VESFTSEDTHDPALDQVADEIIRKLGLTRSANFRQDIAWRAKVAPNVNEDFEFSHAIKNGDPTEL